MLPTIKAKGLAKRKAQGGVKSKGYVKKPTAGNSYGSSEAHNCNWPGCTRQVNVKSWGCRDHMAALPLDLRMHVATSWGPPSKPSLVYVQRDINVWVSNQNPDNYRKGLFIR